MIMSELRGGLIGCGFFSINHLHGWRGVEGASIVAICDRDANRLAIAGDQFGIARRYTDAEEMLARAKSSTSSTSPPRSPSHRVAGRNGRAATASPSSARSLSRRRWRTRDAMVTACDERWRSAHGA